MPPVKASKNRYVGARIRALEELIQISYDKRSVCLLRRYGYRIIPAAWIINESVARIYCYIENGWLFYCVKEEEL